ncbi:PD-(D/E)XK nuclease-like domain-containing protein [Pontibacter sp. H249]|uniref:PD-(D/E)XK nuclease-like domain-containing protein n=1 Tax=Pontibacter sp. H249 TaxID=3133420 RepID=UPI0030BDF1F7
MQDSLQLAGTACLIQKDSNAYYHAQTNFIGSSGLKLINKKSVFHYFNQPPQKQSSTLVFGSAYHTLVLEPEQFEKEYYCLNDCEKVAEIGGANPRATKLYKEWRAEQEALNEGKICLSLDDYQKLMDMHKALFSNASIKQLFSKGTAEVSHYVDYAGVNVKVRPDYLKSKAIVDLKTCEDASPEGFSRAAANYGYHLQAALYCDVLEHATQEERLFVFVAQEKEYPYAAAIYKPTEGFMAQGRYEYQLALDKYTQALNSGLHHGYEMYAPEEAQGVIELDLPAYAYKEKL